MKTTSGIYSKKCLKVTNFVSQLPGNPPICGLIRQDHSPTEPIRTANAHRDRRSYGNWGGNETVEVACDAPLRTIWLTMNLPLYSAAFPGVTLNPDRRNRRFVSIPSFALAITRHCRCLRLLPACLRHRCSNPNQTFLLRAPIHFPSEALYFSAWRMHLLHNSSRVKRVHREVRVLHLLLWRGTNFHSA